jgi:hypothetical protein
MIRSDWETLHDGLRCPPAAAPNAGAEKKKRIHYSEGDQRADNED